MLLNAWKLFNNTCTNISGALGALSFLESRAEEYHPHVNIVVAPCVSPWGYETVNRWNPLAVDPNRSFKSDGKVQVDFSEICHSLRCGIFLRFYS